MPLSLKFQQYVCGPTEQELIQMMNTISNKVKQLVNRANPFHRVNGHHYIRMLATTKKFNMMHFLKEPNGQ